jgi:hypothetical protein
MGSYSRFLKIGLELSTAKILEEDLVQSTLHQILGDEFTFHQHNNLKHKDKSTVELLTKETVNVSEPPSYSFDLNILGNVWQGLKMVV